jgi:hypothetical protein
LRAGLAALISAACRSAVVTIFACHHPPGNDQNHQNTIGESGARAFRLLERIVSVEGKRESAMEA